MIYVVSSGGLPFNNAVLHINAPAGSTITLKKGTTTVATLAAGKGHTNIDGVTADWYYSVGSANYGAWTVTATKDGETATESVTVNAAKQYDIRLTYNLYIIKNGAAQTGYTISYTDMPTHTLQDGILYLASGASADARMAVGPLPSANNRTKAVFEFEKIADTGTTSSRAVIGEGTGSAVTAASYLADSTAPVTVNVDISTFTVYGLYAKLFLAQGSQFLARKAWLKNVYLAR